MKKKTTWTQSQQQVIDLRGSSMLVSAAAGSGKTAVLTERILSRICDPVHPVDIDKILVVTFTSAAAQEMRQRIRDKLRARLEENPGSAHLRAQITLLGHAQISTIHSFCLDVLRSGFDRIGLDPSFRVADEGELKLMRYDAASQVLEEAYAQADPGFIAFTESFAPGRDDSALEQLLISFYDQSDANPWPAKWREECVRQLSVPVSSSLWMQEILQRRKRRLSSFRFLLEEALGVIAEPDGPRMYEDAVRSDLALLDTLCGCDDYETMAEAAGKAAFKNLSSKKDDAVSPVKREKVKTLRNQAKDEIKKILDDFRNPVEELQRQQEEAGKLARALCALTDRFEELYEQMRRDKNILSFSDMEHLALRILTEEDGTPSGLAREYAQNFEEIMIDEYQDSNLVQEMILNTVCRQNKGRKNLFMVGDVKQSIYRFRLARPELFLEKYRTYQTLGERKDQPANVRIDLKQNFRSRQEVLHFCNLIFEKIMHRELGGIEYDDDAALYPGAEYPQPEERELLKPEVIILTRRQEDEAGLQPAPQESSDDEPSGQADDDFADDEELTKQAAEARLIAQKIRELVGKQPVTDKESGQLRPAGYGDIAVLLRSPSAWIDTLLEVFRDEQIPVLSAGAAGYFAAREIRIVLSLLSVLDNPRQDIPLAAVLRSPIGNFTNRELAQIRLADPKGLLYDACLAFCLSAGDAPGTFETAGKLEQFLRLINGLRDLVPYTPMQELLQICLDRTGYENIVLAMPGGQRRRENLSMLMEKAADFEAGSYRGLFHFIRYIENLQKYEIDYGEAVAGGGTEAVRILSIHKSKGLEYPIVILGGLGRQFNLRDTRDSILVHQDLGIGMDLVDPAARTRLKPLNKNAVAERIREENLGEELRILYVAMTRAREKLIMTGYRDKLHEAMGKWQMQASSGTDRPGGGSLFLARCPLDWIVPAVLMEQTGSCVLTLTDTARLFMRDVEREPARQADDFVIPVPQPGRVYDPETRDFLERIGSARYPFEAARRIPGKVSVSLLKHLHMDAVEAQMEGLFPKEDEGARDTEAKPRQSALTGAERGTLYHRVLELLDFSLPIDENFVSSQLETMIRCGKIPKDAVQTVSVKKLQQFAESELGMRMRAAQSARKLHRETPFVIGVDAQSVSPDWDSPETVLVQGIIDVWFEEGDGIILLDYKTDHVQAGRTWLLAEKYRVQMEYYRKALERLTGKAVREIWIYSFSAGEAVQVTTW